MQLALGALGAGVGSFFGYASIGWSIGSALGSYLFAPDGPDIEGPRLTDRSVTGSTYGRMRPLLFGTYRMSGEIIWAADLKEYADKEDVGGKGGGGGSYTTYTYTASFAVALCEGEISGIRKIWADNKLIYNTADDADVGQLIISSKIAKGIKVYTGSTTQTADPTIASYLGAANVPGYRGTAYVVFNELAVTDYGNRIPQLTFEVVKDGTYALTSATVTSLESNDHYSGNVILDDGVIFGYPFYGDQNIAGPNKFQAVTDTSGNTTITANGEIDFVTSNKLTNLTAGILDGEAPYFFGVYAVSKSGEWAVVDVGRSTGFNLRIGVLKNNTLGSYGIIGTGLFGCDDAICKTDNDLFNIRFEGVIPPPIVIVENDDLKNPATIFFYHWNDGKLYRFDIKTYVTMTGTSHVVEREWVVEVDSTRYGTNALPGSANYGMAVDRDTNDIYCILKNADTGVVSVKRFDSDGNELEHKFQGVFASEGIAIAYANGLLWYSNGATGGTTGLWVYDWETEELLYSKSISAYYPGSLTPPDLMRMDAAGTVCAIKANNKYSLHYISLPRNGEALSSVVEAICNRVGIESSDINVTELASDTVRGYLISEQTPARSALEQLSAAYFFDGRESDGLLEFIKRGSAASVTLDDDDIGCYEGDDVQELAEAIRIQEEELPRALTIQYANHGRDYQVGAQHSVRQTVLNGTESTIQLPMAFTDDEAKAIVDKWMFVAWENRHKFVLKTWQAFHKIDPADVITARGQTLRVIRRDEGVNGIIELEAVRELPQIYTGQVGVGAPSVDSGQSVYIGGPTISYLLDIPPLRDKDASDHSFYWAADGVLDDWRGATLLRFDDPKYNILNTSDDDAVTGYTLEALGDWAGDNTFDETNIVRVYTTGVLETKTELEVLNGANAARLGDEIFQFRTASLVSTNVYDLSGLLRGRIGTDWAMGSHADNETFVLLNETSLRKVDLESTDLNTQKLYGTVTNGKTIEDMLTQSFTYTGNNLKPLTPVHIGGGTEGFGGAWLLNWIDRTRKDWQWRDYFDAGNDEPTQDFEIRVYDSYDNPTTVLRTIDVSNATSATYSNANQVADFGIHQSRLAVDIRKTGITRNSEYSDIILLDSGVDISRPVLLHLDGANGSTTFTNSSNLVSVITFTPTNATISTSQSKFGGASGFFNGTNASLVTPQVYDYLHLASHDFTIDFWIYVNSFTGTSQKILYSNNAAVNSGGMDINIHAGSNTVRADFYNDSGVAFIQLVSSAISAGAWVHVAITRSGSVFRLFINGTMSASSTFGNSVGGRTNPLYIGRKPGTTDFLNAYLDEMRILKGTAAWTSSFTPPTSAYS
jgi:hypothetical protein